MKHLKFWLKHRQSDVWVFRAMRMEAPLSHWDWYLWTKCLFCSICQHAFPFSEPFSRLSQHLYTSGMERGGSGGPSFPILLFLGGVGGVPSLVCDLVFHMIEICLILLRTNVLHWHRGDSRREGKGEDEREEEGNSLKATSIFCPTFFFFLRIYPCAFMFVPV